MARSSLFAALLVAGIAASAGAEAASLGVTPVTVSRIAPAGAGALTLTNNGTRPINVQIRVFRWQQQGSSETLVPTTDVVVSPPMTVLTPGMHYTVRVVRIARTPVVGEESYRVFVDELPDLSVRTPNTVRLVLRYSIPVFFAASDAAPARVAWDVRYHGGQFSLAAVNSGATRMQVAGVSLKDAAGATYTIADGLVGYVLGGSAMKWNLRARLARSPRPGPALLSCKIDGNVIQIPVTLRSGG